MVFAAEGWPDCLNPILDCASLPWNRDWDRYTVLQHVLPRAMQLDPAGNYVASPLLAQAPSLSNGGLRIGPPFTVALHIRNQAVWDDGSPITSEDVAFTWKAIVYTKGSAEASRYGAIRSIDTTDPKTAIVEFRGVTARWPEFLGGSRGFILKRAAFPRADPAKPNLRRTIGRGIPFSGGPWILRHWSKDQAVLVRNDRYWGTRPALDSVFFVPRSGWDEEIESLSIGEVAAAFPQPPWSMGSLDSMAFNPNLHAEGRDGIRFEALWFNPRLRPLNNRAVREALMYAVDRQAIVDAFVKLNNPRAEVLNCGFVALPDGPWCGTRPFARFSHDPERARAILEAGGYDCSGRICRKNGKRLQIRYVTNDISRFQTSIAQLVQEQAAEAGIELRPVHFDAGVLAGFACPFPDVAISQCAISAPADGSLTDIVYCDGIPVAGRNHVQWCNREAHRLLAESDRQLDPARRIQLLSRVHQIQADVFMGLPLFVMPAVSYWRTDKIAGPIGRYSSTPYGMFFNMNEWHAP